MRKALTIILAVTAIFMFSIPAMADSTANANANANAGALATGGANFLDQSDNSTNTSEAMDRGFPIPGNVGYGPVINYYGKPLPTAQFRPVESLLMYANIFS